MNAGPHAPTQTRKRALSDDAWETQAACRRYDPEIWFPQSYTGPTALAQISEAQRICNSCPVKAACLDDAMGREGNKSSENRHGICGGLTPDERYQLYRNPRQEAKAP